MIPGSNILNLALGVIAAQTIQWLQFNTETVQSNMAVSLSYKSPVAIKGSLQPVPRHLLELLGLDMNKSYVNIFTSNNVIDIERDISSDRFTFGGNTYQGLSSTPWANIDGWNQILCVQVPN